MKEYYYKIKKICQWIPILWKDFDWDWVFIVEILCYKLERTRKCILENNVIQDAQKVHDEILEVELLLRKAIESDECLKTYERNTKKHLKDAFSLMHKNMLGWWD